jgi:hypothetical protein
MFIVIIYNYYCYNGFIINKDFNEIIQQFVIGYYMLVFLLERLLLQVTVVTCDSVCSFSFFILFFPVLELCTQAFGYFSLYFNCEL